MDYLDEVGGGNKYPKFRRSLRHKTQDRNRVVIAQDHRKIAILPDHTQSVRFPGIYDRLVNPFTLHRQVLSTASRPVTSQKVSIKLAEPLLPVSFPHGPDPSPSSSLHRPSEDNILLLSPWGLPVP